MLNVGDMVKVLPLVECASLITELYPVGTIGKIVEIDEQMDGTCFRVVKLEELENANDNSGWWYKKEELEKGSLEWRPENGL